MALRGAQVGAVVALLDGTNDIAAVLRARPGKMEAEQTIRVLERLVQAGLVVLRTPGATSTSEPALTFWDACDVDPGGSAARPAASAVGLLAVSEAVETTAAAEALRAAGLPVITGTGPRPAGGRWVTCRYDNQVMRLPPSGQPRAHCPCHRLDTTDLSGP
jgi:hypothetical protein